MRREIERTREELGETVQALAAKADVKARANEKVDEVKANAQAKADEVKQTAKSIPAPLIAAGVVVGVLTIWMLTRRGH